MPPPDSLRDLHEQRLIGGAIAPGGAVAHGGEYPERPPEGRQREEQGAVDPGPRDDGPGRRGDEGPQPLRGLPVQPQWSPGPRHATDEAVASRAGGGEQEGADERRERRVGVAAGARGGLVAVLLPDADQQVDSAAVAEPLGDGADGPS